MIKIKKTKFIFLIPFIFVTSCKTTNPFQQTIQLKNIHIKIQKSKVKTKTIKPKVKKNSFLGIYFMLLNKNNILSYSVEFKKDKTARVILFKKNRKKPIISNGKYLFSKKNKDIIILYFPNHAPSEFFLNNHNGTLSLLDKNQKNYKDYKIRIFTLKKIK